MIAWRPWSAEAFAAAKRFEAPVLLLLAPRREKAEIEKAFDGLQHLAERFVTVAVEDRDRPDVALRYGGRGEALLLDHDGEVLDSAALAALSGKLASWLETFAARAKAGGEKAPAGPVWTGAVGGPGRPTLTGDRPREAARAALAARKIPLPALELLIYAGAEWGDASARSRAETELAELARARKRGELELYEWAYAARLMWDAFAAFGDAKVREAALESTVALVADRFDPERRAFRHAAAAGAPLYADENALAALALQRASVFEPGARFGQTADEVLAYLRGSAYDPLLGMLHGRRGDDMVFGLLGDAAWTILAFTEAFQLTAHKPHREFADNLARFLFQELWDRDGGGFLDRIAQREDTGLLKRPRLARLEDNAAALEGLWRLHHLKGNTNYRRWLEWALARLGGEADLSGAGVARVQDMLQRGRLYLELIGRPGEDGRADLLLAAAHRHYAPRRVISFVDPDDQDYILAHKLEAPSYPRLFGSVELRPVASAGAPDEVPSVIRALS
jgi:hypothetical protein